MQIEQKKEGKRERIREREREGEREECRWVGLSVLNLLDCREKNCESSMSVAVLFSVYTEH